MARLTRPMLVGAVLVAMAVAMIPAASAGAAIAPATAPTVTRVSPAAGGSAGGTTVAIVGTSFTGATGVMFGSVAAASFTVKTVDSISAVSPPQGGGPVDITVTTPSGTSTPVAADTFTYNVPTITRVSPASGPTTGGTSVTITGKWFTGASNVLFGANAATSVTVKSGTSIVAVSPPAASPGAVDIIVTNAGGNSLPVTTDTFTYANTGITSVSPNAGPVAGGTKVTIHGVAFNGVTAVSFGSVAASFTVVSPTTITAYAPEEPPGTVDVELVNAAGPVATTSGDHYTYKLPAVSRLTPASGSAAGGLTVTITGAYFTDATQVLFGSIPATSFTFVRSTTITAVSPPLPIGTYDVTVEVAQGSSAITRADKFTATGAGCPTPADGEWIGTFTNTSGPGTWTASTSFSASAPGLWSVSGSFDLDGSPYGTIVPGTSQLSCRYLTVNTLSGSVTGSLSGLLSDNGDNASMSAGPNQLGGETVLAWAGLAVPSVTGISPSTGPDGGGTSVTITGTNLGDVTQVLFGTAAATSVTVVSPTEVTVDSPAVPAGTETVDVTVVATAPPGLSATSATSSADQFTYYPYLGSKVVQVATAGQHSCALLANGTVQCWGDNATGELGNGTTNSSSTPVAVTGITTATAISAGGGYFGGSIADNTTCALLSNHTIECWGANTSGQLGNGTLNPQALPVAVSGITTAIAISAGQDSTCAVLSGGTVKCWGDNSYGELGVTPAPPYESDVPTTVSLPGAATAVSTGGWHACAVLTTGTIYCWGLNSYGELGNGTTSANSTPVKVSGISSAVSVAAFQPGFTGPAGINLGSTCAVLTGGSVDCWGSNYFGELGNGTNISSSTPVAVSGITSATEISAAASHACAVLSDGSEWCWGQDFNADLGNGNYTNEQFCNVEPGLEDYCSSTPTQVVGVFDATDTSAGMGDTCVLLADGSVECWGDNTYGQIGNGSTYTYFATPAVVSGF